MTSQTGLQTITINILPNISQSKGNQTMKFGRLVESKKKKNTFFQIYTENQARRLVPALILFF